MKIVVVGKGILGLSVAEALSRRAELEVYIVSHPNYSEASASAAANLSTKSQVFARDTHFDLKLASRHLYSEWLRNMRREIELPQADDLSKIYKLGVGRDVFSNENLANRQWQRALQSPDEIHIRGLSPQKIYRVSPRVIEYQEEGWVSAQHLLELLEQVCRKRGVQFLTVDMTELEKWPNELMNIDHLVLCTGWMTPQILARWNIRVLPAALQRNLRWSFGGTARLGLPAWEMPEDLALLEICSSGVMPKFTLSGGGGQLFGSSVSVSCANTGNLEIPQPPSQVLVEEQMRAAVKTISSYLNTGSEKLPFEWRWGMRLGYGHKELVVEKIEPSHHKNPHIQGVIVVAAGAHKSGFLFAPSIGESVLQKLHDSV
ncbi:FAD-dependent oxidoreductase [bacterium]|nr:FAD-dependent oxidoreductase [bacterium]